MSAVNNIIFSDSLIKGIPEIKGVHEIFEVLNLRVHKLAKSSESKSLLNIISDIRYAQYI